MIKQTSDIKPSTSNEKIDLKGEEPKKKMRLKKNKNILYKEQNPVHEVKDINGGEKKHYLYVKGKKFTPPKFLGNLVKVAAMGFVILIIINALNVYFVGKGIEKEISITAYEGYNYLLDAGKSATKIQFDNALFEFDKALENFKQAEEELWFINKDPSFYAKESDLTNAATALVQGGQYFAVAGKYFLEAVEEFNKVPIYFISKNNEETFPPPSITETLKKGLEKTDLAIEQISLAAKQMENINEEVLPKEIQARFILAKEKITEISDILKETSRHFPAFLKLLGDRYPHRYLILLQNNNEIRPSGGFIGSYAIIDVNDGYIENLEIKDVYDIDNLYGEYIEPPEELKDIVYNWRFRDSNYSSDFELTAKKTRWFLEKEGGPTVDTVIAINQGLLKDMLGITGPIQVGNFGTLDAENYSILLSYIVEGKIWGEEDPKHILKVFIPEFKNAILKEENLSKVSSKLYKAVQQKHIMVYSSDDEVQGLIEALNLDGKVYRNEADEDYLSVINISTGGNKSDQFIEEEITHNTYIDKEGNVIDEIKIERTHLWTDGIYDQWKSILADYGLYELPDWLTDILGRGRNKVSVQIYVPQGSQLIEYEGRDVEQRFDKDLDKTFFFTSMTTQPGETSKVWIKYSLPFNIQFAPAGAYKLIVEKQPGSRGSIFTKTVYTDEELQNLAIYPEGDVKVDENGNAIYATNLVYDKYFAGVWEK